jgi:glutathione S-transferase
MASRYTLVIGTKDWSSWSLRPYVALRAAKVRFEEVVIPLRRENFTGDEIRKYSKAGHVPILRIQTDGREVTVWDSLAICETIAELHPEAGLWPDDPFTRAEARSYAAEMHSGFPDVRDQLLPELRDATKTQIARIIEAWSSALERFGADGGFLFGRLSIADCMYAPVVSRFTTFGVEVPAPATAYMARMMALPAMQDWAMESQKEVDAGIA